jgi:DNA polymerase-3 subunit delta'
LGSSQLAARGAPEVPRSLAEATERQPAARAALAAALASGAGHAYLFAGPGGSSVAASARAFASELLALGAPDPDGARARALADPSPHPDLVWLVPPGAQHLVEEVREQVIRGAAYRPFEGERRVFVIEEAEAMADESQNALLKTLEEPPPYVHLLLLSSEPAGLRETVISRCQRIRFQAPSPDEIESELEAAGAASELERRAASRLCGGDSARARLLIDDRGREIRAAAERCARAARAARLDDAPWRELIELAERAGEDAGREAGAAIRERGELAGDRQAKARAKRDAEAAARRADRRARTEAIDLALALAGAWFRDLAALGEGAGELLLNADREPELTEDAAGVDPRRARRAVELSLETRRRLSVNVSEELALEALFYRAGVLLTSA